MKGDFSRQTFDPLKHYSSVLMQQGRVQLDADWNEQQAISHYREVTENMDVIGASGAPIEEAGFLISALDDKLLIGGGRYYVDGMLCENEATVEYKHQPDFPDPPDPAVLLSKQKNPLGLVYLDSWQRHLTALDDPSIREQALGADGPDTTTRIKTVWQTKVMPVTPDFSSLVTALKSVESQLKNLGIENTTLTNNELIIGIVKTIDAFLDGKNTDQLDKFIEIFAQIINVLISDKFLRTINLSIWDKIEKQILLLEGAFLAFEANLCKQEFPEWKNLITEPKRTLNARTQPSGPIDSPCQLPPTAGYQRLENQLYRVEILQGGDPTQDNVTFVWSRDNGSVVTSIVAPIPANVGVTEVTVASLGPDTELGFAKTQLVEIIDDTLELAGKPGQLVTITDINRATLQVTFDRALSVDYTLHPKMRRWDGTGNVVLPSTSDDWIALEGGIQIQFAPGNYKTGDYWLIPARTASGQIEWPIASDGTPIAQPPLGIQHHYSRLALVWYEQEHQQPRVDIGSNINGSAPANSPISPIGLSVRLMSRIDTSIAGRELIPGLFNLLRSVEEHPIGIFQVWDCRSLFSSLTDQPSTLHVIKTSWRNSGILSISDFNKFGLLIYLDGIPNRDSLLNGITVIVTVEYPYEKPFVSTIAMTLSGQIDIINNVIRWRYIPNRRQARNSSGFFSALETASVPYLVRVTLKGHAIWGTTERHLHTQHMESMTTGHQPESPMNGQLGSRSYLDGQTLCVPGAQSTLTIDAKILSMLGLETSRLKTTSRTLIDLQFPSGAGVRASDFESWFYIDTTTDITHGSGAQELQVTNVKFYSITPDSVEQVKPVRSYSTDPGDVQFKISDQINVIEVDFNLPISLEDFMEMDIEKGVTLSLTDGSHIVGTLHVNDARTAVRFTHVGHQPLTAGSYRLTVTSIGATGPLVTSAEEGTRLVKDYIFLFVIV